MSKRTPSIINGQFVKQPSNREVEAAVKQRQKEEAELKAKMNIQPRDSEKYPMPPEDELKKAGTFLYTMTTLASSYDENLNAIIWSFYVDWMKCMDRASDENTLVKFIKSLTNLKEYLLNSGNPLFNLENPKEGQEGQEETKPEGPAMGPIVGPN